MLSKTEHFEILSFSDQGLRVPAVTSGPRIDPIENLWWILEFFEVDIESTWCDEKNTEIILKREDIEFSAKFA